MIKYRLVKDHDVYKKGHIVFKKEYQSKDGWVDIVFNSTTNDVRSLSLRRFNPYDKFYLLEEIDN